MSTKRGWWKCLVEDRHSTLLRPDSKQVSFVKLMDSLILDPLYWSEHQGEGVGPSNAVH